MDGNGSPKTAEMVLADDDEVMRLVFPRILNRDPRYSVTPAADGREALSIITADVDLAIAVLITDYEMPEMNGMQLVAAVRELRPDIFIVMMSGKAKEVEFNRTLAATCPEPPNIVLSKPIEIADLTSVINPQIGFGEVVT